MCTGIQKRAIRTFRNSCKSFVFNNLHVYRNFSKTHKFLKLIKIACDFRTFNKALPPQFNRTMTELIKQALSKYAGQDLSAADVQANLAADLAELVSSSLTFQVPEEDTPDRMHILVSRATFTPQILHLIGNVAGQLQDDESIKSIDEAYNQIISDIAPSKNNGVMLLALTQALVTLLISATSQVPDETAEPTSTPEAITEV